MSDVVITDSDSDGSSPTEEQQVAAVAETAGSAAEAGAAAEDAKEAEVAAEASADISAAAAVAAVQEAQRAQDAATEAMVSLSVFEGGMERLTGRIDELAAVIAQANQPLIPPAQEQPPDTQPNNDAPAKTPFLAKRWGRKK